MKTPIQTFVDIAGRALAVSEILRKPKIHISIKSSFWTHNIAELQPKENFREHLKQIYRKVYVWTPNENSYSDFCRYCW